MGSIVFPKANLKIYIDAPISVRAERRYNQLKDIEKDVNLENLKLIELKNICNENKLSSNGNKKVLIKRINDNKL